MKKQVESDIQEIIEFLLNVRERTLIESEEIAIYMNSSPDNIDYNIQKEKDEILENFDKRLITLNNLLKKEKRNSKVLDIELEMKKIQSKKNITVKEFSEIYNVSKTSQQNYRSRLNDPLPYHQKVEGGKITYIVEEVEKWLENQHK